MAFVNTTYTDIIASQVNSFKERLNNNLYKFNDQQPTIVTYYNLDIHLSVMDEPTGLKYSNNGNNSGFKYNKINNFLLYGLNGPINLDMDDGEFGIQSGEISGDAIILPNTIIPYEGDYFTINHIKEQNYLFKVLAVHPDTLDNGSNFYRIEYKLSEVEDNDNIESHNLVYTYEMVMDNVGTSFKSIIRSDVYNTINNINETINTMKEYYISLFFNKRVDTFIFSNNLYDNLYDPYMIEFLLQTKILNRRGRDYIHIDHKIKNENIFNMKYDKTLLGKLSKNNKQDIFNSVIYFSYKPIESKINIFSTRLEQYFTIDTEKIDKCSYRNLYAFKEDLLERLESGELFNNNVLENLIIKQFYDLKIDEKDMNSVKDFLPNMENNSYTFYITPCILYCLESYIKNLLK